MGWRKFDCYLVTEDTKFIQKFYPELDPRECVNKDLPPRDMATLTVGEIAKVLNISRQSAHDLVTNQKVFATARRIGSPTKPVYMVDAQEVAKYKKQIRCQN